MIKISPSLLSADFTRLGEELRAVEAAGADYLHVDVMDGHFVPNITIGPPVVQALGRIASKPLDVHLMIAPVDPFIPEFAKAARGGIVTIHAEAGHHLDRSLSLIKEHGCRAGVSYNPATPIAGLEHVLHLVDLVLIMSVNPGFGGQSFIPTALDKVRAVRWLIDQSGREIELELDGGIKPDNIGAAAAAGADVFVAGSAVFNAPDYAEMIQTLRREAERATAPSG